MESERDLQLARLGERLEEHIDEAIRTQRVVVVILAGTRYTITPEALAPDDIENSPHGGWFGQGDEPGVFVSWVNRAVDSN